MKRYIENYLKEYSAMSSHALKINNVHQGSEIAIDAGTMKPKR